MELESSSDTETQPVPERKPRPKPIENKRNDSISNLKRIAAVIFNIFKGVILLFILAFLFRIFVIQPFLVDGPSMEPNFADKEYLLVNKITPKISGYQRGNVVIFKYPQNEKLVFIKRIIGMPGETIEIENGKIKIINAENPKGKILQEDYLPAEIYTATAQDEFLETLVEDEYFVLGDNRKNSLDSREFGPIVQRQLVGKTWFSFRTFHTIPRPQYNVLIPRGLRPAMALHF